MTFETFCIVFIIVPLILGAAYSAYRVLTAPEPDWNAYAERQKEINELMMQIMKLQIELEIKRQLREREEE